jgi:hypothetical protein
VTKTAKLVTIKPKMPARVLLPLNLVFPRVIPKAEAAGSAKPVIVVRRRRRRRRRGGRRKEEEEKGGGGRGGGGDRSKAGRYRVQEQKGR